MREMAAREENTKALEKAAHSVKGRVSKGYLERELGEKLIRQIATSLLTRTIVKEKVPAVHIKDRAMEIAARLSAMPGA
jgi:RNA-binding protein YhbY